MIEHRFLLTCGLDTPLRVSAGEESAISDAAVWRRADGTPIVPGTSIAGALRQAVERLAGVQNHCRLYAQKKAVAGGKTECGCAVCKLFGDVSPVSKRALPSRVRVSDAVVSQGAVRVVDSVAIDRTRGAAAEKRKFDHEELRPGLGVSVAFEVRVSGTETEATSPTELEWLGTALRALATGALPLGGRVATGLGRLAWREGEHAASLRARDLGQPDQLAQAVLHGGDAAWPMPLAATLDELPGGGTLPGREALRFRLRTAEESTFLVADPLEAARSGFDRAPRGGPLTPELPGASLRGALRSGAERILRTLGAEVCDPTRPGECCADREQAAAKMVPPRSHRRCLACEVFGNERWASRVAIVVRPARAATGTAPYGASFDHVAIDRFTGGARDGLKFDAQSARRAVFELECVVDAPTPADRDRARAVLLLAVRDLARGRITVGHGSARGHGWLRVDGDGFAPTAADEIAVQQLVESIRSTPARNTPSCSPAVGQDESAGGAAGGSVP